MGARVQGGRWRFRQVGDNVVHCVGILLSSRRILVHSLIGLLPFLITSRMAPASNFRLKIVVNFAPFADGLARVAHPAQKLPFNAL